MMRNRFGPLGCLAFLAALWTAPAAAEDPTPGELVDKARITVERLSRHPDLGANVRRFIGEARALLIFPQLIKGAFLFGGEGGSGVLVARDKRGRWSYPAFYTMASFSFGLQFGGQTAEAILVLRTEGALKSVLDDQLKLGADASVAAGPVGAGIEGGTTTNVGADILSYSTSQGLFAGASLEGAVIARRNDWNQAYYDPAATPHSIVIDRRHANPDADRLRETLAGF